MKRERFVRCGKIATLCIFMLVLATAGCEYMPFGYATVGEILSNPSAYDNREVKVRGTVSEVTKIPFIDLKIYALNDGGSRIVVVTQGSTPPAGAKVTVVGRVENVAIVGNESIGLHIRELKRVDKPVF
jgi:hypothetical protein